MVIFEFVENREAIPGRKLRVLVIGETYRAYEQTDGSVVLNDEKAGFTFHPAGSYEDFRAKFEILC
ncbi:hypothetical protein key_101 [Erwinia phage KEY]|uniref:Uncharacterized protein n=1 Tax=Erwinia phage KEY TaxID=2821255 RepID=A0A9Y1EQE6_9CAUD|nr:hypothetical protein key_101 [Erwinia phage KEY]